MSEPAFTVEYAVTEEAYVAANKRLFWYKMRRLLVVLALMLVIGVGLFFFGGASSNKNLFPIAAGCLGGSIGGGVVMLINIFAIPRQSRKIYMEHKSLKLKSSICLFEDRVEAENSAGFMRLDWDDFLKWDKSDTDLFLFVNSVMFIMVPLASLGESATNFAISRAAASGLPLPRKTRKK